MLGDLYCLFLSFWRIIDLNHCQSLIFSVSKTLDKGCMLFFIFFVKTLVKNCKHLLFFIPPHLNLIIDPQPLPRTLFPSPPQKSLHFFDFYGYLLYI